MLTTKDIAWAAGFMEGEGSFYYDAAGRASSLTVRAAQVQREPLERLQRMFGGTIGHYENGKGRKAQWIHQWYVHGKRAAEVIMTLLALLSPRRFEQAVKALEVWKAKPVSHYDRRRCKAGHEYQIRKRGERTSRYCPTCQNRRGEGSSLSSI